MEYRRDQAFDPSADERGQPGSDDAYARGAGPSDGVAQPVTGEISDADAGGGASGAGESGSAAPGSAASAGAAASGVAEVERDKYLRLAADYENFRRRAARERQEAARHGQAEMVRGMLEALDDLGRFAHVDPATVEAATVVQGAEMVEKKLLKTLAGHGLEVINPVDHPFDPALHEAVGTEPAMSREDDHLIARVYQPGYVFNGQLLRPARVVVKQWIG
jgi:molecular chaperone GrpE